MLARAEQEVRDRRDAAEQDPAGLPALASALHRLSHLRAATGDRAGAPAPAKEAARIYAELGMKRPGDFQAELALTMGALGDRVADTGDPAAAVPFVKQSVRLQRELVEEQQPGASVPALAEYLLNYAARPADAGRTVAAVPQAEEAVGLLRGLAEEDPDAFLPRLAAALHALGHRRAAVSDTSGAVEAAHEARGRFRLLAARRPEFRPELAAAMDGFAGHSTRRATPGRVSGWRGKAWPSTASWSRSDPRPSARASPPRCAPSPGAWPVPKVRRRPRSRHGRPSSSCGSRATPSWASWPTPSRCSAPIWSGAGTPEISPYAGGACPTRMRGTGPSGLSGFSVRLPDQACAGSASRASSGSGRSAVPALAARLAAFFLARRSLRSSTIA